MKVCNICHNLFKENVILVEEVALFMCDTCFQQWKNSVEKEKPQINNTFYLEDFMNKHWLIIGWVLLFILFILLIIIVCQEAYAITNLSPGECQTFGNETVCAKEIAKSNYICSPNITLSCPETIIPKCPDMPQVNAICSPNITSIAWTSGARIVNKLEENNTLYPIIYFTISSCLVEKTSGLTITIS